MIDPVLALSHVFTSAGTRAPEGDAVRGAAQAQRRLALVDHTVNISVNQLAPPFFSRYMLSCARAACSNNFTCHLSVHGLICAFAWMGLQSWCCLGSSHCCSSCSKTWYRRYASARASWSTGCRAGAPAGRRPPARRRITASLLVPPSVAARGGCSKEGQPWGTVRAR